MRKLLIEIKRPVYEIITKDTKLKDLDNIYFEYNHGFNYCFYKENEVCRVDYPESGLYSWKTTVIDNFEYNTYFYKYNYNFYYTGSKVFEYQAPVYYPLVDFNCLRKNKNVVVWGKRKNKDYYTHKQISSKKIRVIEVD